MRWVDVSLTMRLPPTTLGQSITSTKVHWWNSRLMPTLSLVLERYFLGSHR